MTLPLTPEMLAAAYDYLSLTPPFDKWGLPPSDEVGFRVAKTTRASGWYQWDGKRHTITGSRGGIGHTSTLFELMAHEMVHLHLEDLDMETAGSNDKHSGAFRTLANEVCKVHGFDPKAFY